MNPSVLLVGNFLSSSGGSRGVCEELAARLRDSGIPVLTTSNKRSKVVRLLDMLRTIVRERRTYSVAQVDVFSGQAFIWAQAACAALRACGKPYVLTLHGGNLPVFARKYPGRVRHLLQSAHYVTVPSRFLQESMSWFRSDLMLLPNALDLSRYAFKLRTQPKPCLVWLRAFHKTYNPTLAVKTLALLLRKFPNATLVMAGPDKRDGSLDQTRKFVDELALSNRISFPGQIEKTSVPNCLNQGDIFLNTTDVDNTPVSVIEALACGLCVVTTNVGGIPWLVEHEKKALLVMRDDAPAMAGAVERILSNPALAQTLSSQGRAQVEQYDWSIVLPQWRELLGKAARSAGLRSVHFEKSQAKQLFQTR